MSTELALFGSEQVIRQNQFVSSVNVYHPLIASYISSRVSEAKEVLVVTYRWIELPIRDVIFF